MSRYSLFTACWSGSFLSCSSATTFSHWSRSWKCRWHDSPRRRWRSRGIGIDEQEKTHRRSGVGPRVWRVGSDFAKDVRFISEMIDKLEAAYNIDPARIYANGFSNGGGMAFVLSCTMSDRIAAVGMVGTAQTLPWSWCTEY